MKYVRNAWYAVAWSNELLDDTPHAISILAEPVVIYRASKSGRIVALEDRCVHRLAPLSLGRCEGDHLRCMYHGLLFDHDGKVVEMPGQEKIPPRARVKSFRVAERGSLVWVWMGDPEEADDELIPPTIGPDHPDYLMGQGHLDYEAEARLINDNLLDFSHLTYVHAASFEAGADFAESLPKVETLERGVRYTRWILDDPGPAGRRSGELFDNYMSYEFLVPGVLLMWSGSFPVGTAKKYNFTEPDRDQAVSGVTFTSQAVTPMTEKTSRYFFCWGPHIQHGDGNLRDTLMSIADKAFAEDKAMIEAQQKVIDQTPNPRIMPSAHDRGVTIFNRMLERMRREEASSQ